MAQRNIRLVFSLTKSGSQVEQTLKRALDTYAQALVNEVTIEESDRTYKQVITRIQKQITTDLGKEIQKVASQFARSVPGVGSRIRGPRGTLSFHAQKAQGWAGPTTMALAGSVPKWTQRRERYLERKQKDFGHRDWYSRTGALREFMKNGGAWTDAFGTTQVVIRRNNSATAGSQFNTGYGFGTPGKGKSFERRLTVCTIQVRAMKNITGAMLPALVSGDPRSLGGDGRANGLLRLFPDDIRYKLGGKQAAYRHTVEPFLGFLLARAIPNAVFKRIETGLGTKINATGDSTFR